MAKAKARAKRPGAGKATAPERPVPIADLDTTYADAVRAGPRDQLHIGRLQKAYAKGAAVPAVTVTTWPGGRLFLADGGYRVAAKVQAGATRVPAAVVECRTEAAARAEALRIAAGANEHPGQTRSTDDLRAAVRAYITAAWNEWVSDREAAEAIGCHPTVVKSVRLELSAGGAIPAGSPAHASRRGYKEGSRPRGGYVLTEDGKTVRADQDNGIDRAITPAGAGPEPPAPDPQRQRDTDPPRGLDSAGADVRTDNPAPDRPAVPVRQHNQPAPAPLPPPEDRFAHWLRVALDDYRRLYGSLNNLLSTPGAAVVLEVAAAGGHPIEEESPYQDRHTDRATGWGWSWATLKAVGMVLDGVANRPHPRSHNQPDETGRTQTQPD